MTRQGWAVRNMDALADVIARAKRADDPYLEGLQFSGEELDPKLDVGFFELHNLEFDHCTFVGGQFQKASFYDCTFTACDFSNAQLAEAYLARTRLVDCKLEGAQLTKAFLRSSRLTGCRCRYGNWGESTLEGVTFKECDFREAFLNELRLRKGTRFDACDLTQADFFRTRLRGMDLSTCAIAGLGVSDTREELRGVLIAAEQAPDLVGLLGVRIVD